MAYVEPTGTNSYVPSWEATNQIIAFVRDPKKFKLNSYIAYRPATKMVGLYLQYDKDNPARVVTEEEFFWADGAVRPEGNDNLDGFQYQEYRTTRRNIPFTVGNLARKQAPWDLVAAQAAGRMQQFMTMLTWSVWKTLDTTSNWTAGQFDSAANLAGVPGGTWENSDTDTNVIQKSIYAALNVILQGTNSMVTVDMLRLVIGPDAARKMRVAKEILDYIKSSPYALAQVRGELPNSNVLYGLPQQLFGIELVVEDAVRVTTRKGVTATRSFIKDSTKAVILSKTDGLPGDQVGAMPTPNFSTFQVFHYTGDGNSNSGDEKGGPSGLYTVQTFEDTRNERLDGHVVTNFDKRLVADTSGYVITNIIPA